MSEESREICGIIMPISEIDGCSVSHWGDVRSILNNVIDSAGFEPKIVSDGEPTGIIQNRIVQNLYKNPIVVCDVSCRNPNVMFELGMRLTFDKPTVIIKDDKTRYAFDASPIEHIPYPRDLRYTEIEIFKEKLKEKIIQTHKAAEDANFSTFLKHFGEFKVIKPPTVEVDANQYILDELKLLGTQMRAIYSQIPQNILLDGESNDYKIVLKKWANFIVDHEEPGTTDAIRLRIKKDPKIDTDHLKDRLTFALGDTVLLKEFVDDGQEALFVILPLTKIQSIPKLKKILYDELNKLKYSYLKDFK
jgi:hypothetical protein